MRPDEMERVLDRLERTGIVRVVGDVLGAEEMQHPERLPPAVRRVLDPEEALWNLEEPRPK